MLKVANLSVYPKYFKWKFISNPDKFNFEKWVMNKEEIHDCDNSGYRISYWTVCNNGEYKFYRVYHEWYWTNEGGYYDFVNNYFEVRETYKGDIIEEKYVKENLKFLI